MHLHTIKMMRIEDAINKYIDAILIENFNIRWNLSATVESKCLTQAIRHISLLDHVVIANDQSMLAAAWVMRFN